MYGRNLIQNEKPGTDIFLAEQQTAGRGVWVRHGLRPWRRTSIESAPSLQQRLAGAVRLEFGSRCVISKIVYVKQGFGEIGLKWPERYLCDGNKKCGGILIVKFPAKPMLQ